METTEQGPLIALEGLEVRYGNFRALKQLNVAVPGGAVGLLGPNGAGKSTLIKALLGLLELHEGRGRVMGFDVTHFGLEIRRRIADQLVEEDALEELARITHERYALAGLRRWGPEPGADTSDTTVCDLATGHLFAVRILSQGTTNLPAKPFFTVTTT